MADARGPLPNSYSLLDGRLVAGDYPGSRDSAATRQKVGALLDAGVRTFVDLTESHELEPYDEQLWSEAALRGVEAKRFRIPVRDMSVPSSAQVMRKILDTIASGLEEGGVYVHCWGGVGRTGTVVGCHLVRSGMTGDEALARVAELFSQTAKYSGRARSPETAEQAEYVRSWKEEASGK